MVLPRFLTEFFDNVQKSTATDHIRRSQRSDGMVPARDHPTVDVFGCLDSFRERENRFVEHGAEDPVDGEPRGFLDFDMGLPRIFDKTFCRGKSSIGG